MLLEGAPQHYTLRGNIQNQNYKKPMVGVGQSYLLCRHVNEASGELMDY